MADPLSLTLAAVTLATALKDMVELAQAIGESFEKVSRNKRELRSLVSEIKTTLFRLKKFNDDRCDVLCDAVDAKLAILDLITDMRTIHDKCRDMYPPVPPNRIGRFKLDVKAWLNNNKIEEDIRNLRDRVNKCHSEFMMFAIMRIESRLIGTTRQTDERPKQIQEEISTSAPSDDSLIAFMGSNARTLSKLPPEIPVDVISDAYLRIQINTIDYMLNQLSTNSYSVEDPSEEYLHPFSLSLPDYSRDKNSRRQAMVLRSLEIQSYLCDNSQNLSMQAGAWVLVNLCIDLKSLKMYHEALTIIKWGVYIYRALVKVNSTVYMPHLVHSLDVLSSLSINVDNIDGAFSVIEEAVEISRNLQSSTTNMEIEFQLGKALGGLASIWALKDDKEASLKAALEAVDIYKNTIIKYHHSTSSDLPDNFFDSPSASLFEGLPPYAILDYGWALKRLSSSFEDNDRQDDAYKTAREALDVFMFCSNNPNNNNRLESPIASMLYRISCDQFHNVMSLEEALSFSERGVAMFRCLYSEDVEEYSISLYNALWQQANIFGKLERWDEAMVCWRETAELAKDVIADDFRHAAALSRLSSCLREVNQYDEAVSIRKECVTVYTRLTAETDHVARGCYNLGVELQLAGRWPEAIKALQAALTQCRSLAFKDPEYTKRVGDTLNELTRNFIRCKEFDQAFNEGHESLQLHENLIKNDSSVLNEYILALQLNCRVAEVADSEENALNELDITSRTIHSLAKVLSRFGRVSEAGIAMQEALEWHEEHPSQAEKNLEHYMGCLVLMTGILYYQGLVQKAAEYLHKSIDVGKPHSSLKSVSSALVRSMYYRIQYFYVTGQYASAVDASQDCVDFARKAETENIADLIASLQAAALAFKYHGQCKQAIDYIQEALQLSRSSEILETSMFQPAVLVLESESLARFSEILADAGQEVEALTLGKAAVDSALGLKLKHAMLPWSSVEQTYFYALQTYSIRLAVNGDLSDSLDRLVQVRSHYAKRIDSRLGESLDLVCVLEGEGIICCAAGRLDDGAAAVAKLHDLQNLLRIVHPELAQNVQIALERQRASPSMIALVQKLNLKCNHEHQKSAS